MNPKLFGNTSPGELVKIARDSVTGNECAFVPDPLPPDWEFPARLWPLLADSKQQMGILEGIGRSLPNPGILLRPMEDREAILSSRLEGTYVAAAELLVYEIQRRESESEDEQTDRQREVFDYCKSLREGAGSDLPLSLRFIRDRHVTLMSGVRGGDRTPGQFRRIQVAIGSDHRFVPPPPEKLMECLGPLEKYFHEQNSRYDPLVDCFLIHYQFETIHPFSDGNGRVGRLLLAIMLMQLCGLSKPWLYMSEYYEKNREEYVERLFKVSTSADWEGWIEFCLVGVASQARDTIKRCARLQETRDAFRKRLWNAGGNVRLGKIVEDIFTSPFVRITDLAKKLAVSYPTAQKDIERLVEVGILDELENISPKTYYAPEVFNVAYDAME